MFSDSGEFFEKTSRALYRAGLYVSYADITGKKKAQKAEMQALHKVMQILKKENSEKDFMRSLMELAAGEVEITDDFIRLSDEDIKNLQKDLDFVPQEVEEAVLAVIDNFSKAEARLYSDIIISVGSSVAQASDEKDDFFLTGDKVTDSLTLLTNLKPMFYRVLMDLSELRAEKNAKYLYDPKDIFDELKISTKESDALGALSGAVRNAWFSRYPEELEKTVEDYIKETDRS